MIVTRFAPSPTGYLHIGGLRTALFSYLWARKNGGKFLLRIEDTDKARNSQEAAEAIVKAFNWLGLEHDGEITYQSQRDDIYAIYVKQLLDEGKAYRCYMSREELDALRETQMANKERTKYDGKYRDFDGTPPDGVDSVIRIKAPLSGEIIVRDGVKGDVVFKAEDILDDFVIARADGSPTYNFVVAIDDHLMGVTEVIRGDDHLSNTPKQIVIYEALGFDVPKFYHVPMIHNSEGKKLSKRDGATDVMAYKEMGYTPAALLNFLVRLGWSNGDQEIFSMDEMRELFDPKNINRSASIYNTEKLDWLNSHYIKNTPNQELAKMLEEYNLTIASHDKKEILLDALKERAKTLKELALLVTEVINPPASYDEKALEKSLKGEAVEVLNNFIAKLSACKELHLPSEYHHVMQEVVDEMGIGFGKIGQPLRVALLGKMSGPGLDSVMAVIGIDETILRVKSALALVK
ncbi:glutamyl-tRNA synthetase [Sulfurimonas denitrificans DSM 1251]|jgi:glutamyl-tRNA synthetase|uniref:Glutamate--tRNA ligase 1 n=1 Tax=Sulfurimonas denitrificans (strain ATCC 33889 / DSM 1251) TaxID=326298 RepID=SYE1_SULDN|nr:glutamate--tRNA ligase [Sulfurimonas denitrificans]Q30UA5.1 RecName: Full=Glutamate--tRNA ligase 1; AltName: Full=Glutamyl-tRNA synthetase 1; Short=GluRS 1 [Sulfurimonas denitrificans DSM 1251]ABB43426.1 glutamyl-tRNA synthetase [Sulfurimonas denitrificans DSM 1251]MDD3442898.1 glutamate--tRNA ligase [Sulfurimonas denitrificans]